MIDGGLGSNTLVGGSSRTLWDFSATELRNISVIDGGAGHDILTGSSGDDVFVGGSGNDLLQGGAGNDSYQFAAGDGQDTIVASRNEYDSDLLLLANIRSDKLWFTQNRNDLLVSFSDSDDSVTVRDWYVSDQHQLGQIATDTEVLFASDVQLLVDAMAAFEPEAFATGNGFDTTEQPELQSALAAAWQPSAT